MRGKTIRAVIAEDNQENRNYLKGILLKHSDIEVIGLVEQGNCLIEMIKELEPDVAFVDIELPVLDGMTAVKKVRESNPNIIIIFVTAHAELALEAFEVSSVDYILKPYNGERIEKTLEKIRDRISSRDNNKSKDVHITAEKLFIKCGHEITFIDVEQIYFIEKENRKTKIHTISKKYETLESMNTIEKRLNPKRFIRSHKCYIINLSKVEKIQPWGSDSYLVKFNDCKCDALISRSKVKMLHNLLGIR